MFYKFKKGKSYEVGGDGTGWTIDSPYYWYRHTTDWHITSGLNTSGSPESSERSIYFRVKLKGGTAYSLGTYGEFDGKCWLYNESGTELTYNDDGSCEVDGEYYSDCIGYTPSADGIFIFRAGAYSDGQGDIRVCCYPQPEQEEIPESTTVYETSSGFNAMGKPISYRSASGCGINYFTLPVKDGLVFCSNYKKQAIDTVTKTSAELNNVVFGKYNGVDCAYFNGTNSSIIWKNVLKKSLPKFSLVVKFACTYKNGSWRFLFGVSPENNRALGCSLQMHNENNNRFCMIWDNSAFYLISGVEKEVFHVGILTVGDGEVKCYLDGNQVHYSNRTKELPTTSWLYVGGDYGQSNRLWFEGYIAQSILYDRALNEDEVKALSEV